MYPREQTKRRFDDRNVHKGLSGLLVLAALTFSAGCATTQSAAESADRQANDSHRHFKHSIRREARFVNDKLAKASHEGKRLVGAEDEKPATQARQN